MSLSKEFQDLLRKGKNKYSAGSNSVVKLKEGKTQLRILPSPDGGKFWFDLGVHWIKSEANGKPVAVVGCEDTVHDKPCPICAAIEKAAKSATDDQTLNLVKEWKAKETILVNALIRNGENKSDDPVILELTKTTFGNVLSVMEEYSETLGNVTDISVPFDLVIERSGKGLDTKYTVMPAAKPLPVKPEVMKNLKDLSAHVDKEFFKGDETKALTNIANIAGISTGGLIAATQKAGILTGPTAKVVEETTKEEEPAVITKPAATAAPAKAAEPAAVEEMSGDDIDDLLKELENA